MIQKREVDRKVWENCRERGDDMSGKKNGIRVGKAIYRVSGGESEMPPFLKCN